MRLGIVIPGSGPCYLYVCHVPCSLGPSLQWPNNVNMHIYHVIILGAYSRRINPRRRRSAATSHEPLHHFLFSSQWLSTVTWSLSCSLTGSLSGLGTSCLSRWSWRPAKYALLLWCNSWPRESLGLHLLAHECSSLSSDGLCSGLVFKLGVLDLINVEVVNFFMQDVK
jgi:hypothetical protein